MDRINDWVTVYPESRHALILDGGVISALYIISVPNQGNLSSA